MNIKVHTKGFFASVPIIFSFQKNITRHAKREERPQSPETKQASELDSYMTQMLKLSEINFKMIIMNMLGTLMEKVDNGQQQASNASREMEI